MARRSGTWSASELSVVALAPRFILGKQLGRCSTRPMRCSSARRGKRGKTAPVDTQHSFGTRRSLSGRARPPTTVLVDELDAGGLQDSAASLTAGKLGSFRKNIAGGSHRFCFGGFRRRTPGPPPFSSMNSTRRGTKRSLSGLKPKPENNPMQSRRARIGNVFQSR
jgi:hypothetical protein